MEQDHSRKLAGQGRIPDSVASDAVGDPARHKSQLYSRHWPDSVAGHVKEASAPGCLGPEAGECLPVPRCMRRWACSDRVQENNGL